MTLYFYDLETSGLHPFRDRIMQFGGRRLDTDLSPVGDLEEFYVKLSDDVLPHPAAILTHRILPQTANLEGVSEYQFLKWLQENVYHPETVYIGYNNVNFDNLFLRWLHWRNFAPPPPMLASGHSLDIYQLFGLAFDLRPQAMQWPSSDQLQRPSLRLADIARANKIPPKQAHTAGSDVETTIALLRLLKASQPKLWQHFLQLRQADFVNQIIGGTQPFVYAHYNHLASGSRTTLAIVLGEHPTKDGCFIAYDLRVDPRPWLKMDSHQLSLYLSRRGRVETAELPPFSVIDIQQVPPVAPLTVLDRASRNNLGIDPSAIEANRRKLQDSDLFKQLREAYLSCSQQTPPKTSLENKLAQTQFSKTDLTHCQTVSATPAEKLSDLSIPFEEPGLRYLQFLYQARNFPKTLKTDQFLAWQKHKRTVFYEDRHQGLNRFQSEIRKSLLAQKDDPSAVNILEELQLYVENILPEAIEA